jgi:hypothetical protein
MPYPFTPCACEQPPLNQPYSRFRGGRQQSARPAAVFYPLDTPRRTPLLLTELVGFAADHDLDLVVVEDGGHVARGEHVVRVGHEQASLSHGAVAHHHALGVDSMIRRTMLKNDIANQYNSN